MGHWLGITGSWRQMALQVTIVIVLVSTVAERVFAQGAEPAGSPKVTVEPSTPPLPARLTAAIQEGRYEEARQILAEIRRGDIAADRSQYLSLLSAIVERLAGQPAAARSLLQTALAGDPNGRWAAKVRGELAVVELQLGDLPAAEALVRAEATRLLAPERKDQLAAVYETIANRLLARRRPAHFRPILERRVCCSNRQKTWPGVRPFARAPWRRWRALACSQTTRLGRHGTLTNTSTCFPWELRLLSSDSRWETPSVRWDILPTHG